ncbi:hypothetical protein WJX84_007002 [Apatococcus fuscideae]|uniref:Uncharacterized protein n=1 Tax=Apatococcus fuscideae TaxID=2026836 RepID=A0AAW1SSV4_9CHLO
MLQALSEQDENNVVQAGGGYGRAGSKHDSARPRGLTKTPFGSSTGRKALGNITNTKQNSQRPAQQPQERKGLSKALPPLKAAEPLSRAKVDAICSRRYPLSSFMTQDTKLREIERKFTHLLVRPPEMPDSPRSEFVGTGEADECFCIEDLPDFTHHECTIELKPGLDAAQYACTDSDGAYESDCDQLDSP